jgi:hypothetical protein
MLGRMLGRRPVVSMPWPTGTAMLARGIGIQFYVHLKPSSPQPATKQWEVRKLIITFSILLKIS